MPERPFMTFPLPEITNSSAYQGYQRQRQMTLGDLLMENRIVFLQGEIHYANANDVVMKLLYLQSENRRKDIHFYINSPGGSVTAGLAIYDTMQFLSCDVATYCMGQAASMGAMLLTAGAKGKRFALPNASIMIHQPLAGMRGTAEEIMIHRKELRRVKERLNNLLVNHTGKTLAEIEEGTDRDNFMTSQEALDYNLIVRVVTSVSETEG